MKWWLTLFLLAAFNLAFGENPCKTTFTVVTQDLLENINQGLSKDDVKWFQKKVSQKYPDSREALDLAHWFRPDAAIIELILDDGGSGVDLADRLKKELPGLALILWGGCGDLVNDYNRSPKSKHVFLVLQKPLKPRILLAELERLLSGNVRAFHA